MASEEMKGWGAALRVVVRLIVKEIIEKKKAHQLGTLDFSQMFVEMVADRELMEHEAISTFVQEALSDFEVAEQYGDQQGFETEEHNRRGFLKEDVHQTLENFGKVAGIGFSSGFQTFEEIVMSQYRKVWGAYNESKTMSDALLMEIVEDSSYQDVEEVRRAIRSGDLLVFRTLGYVLYTVREHYSVLSDGTVIHDHRKNGGIRRPCSLSAHRNEYESFQVNKKESDN